MTPTDVSALLGQHLAREIGLHILGQRHIFGIAQGAVGLRFALGLALLRQHYPALFIAQGAFHRDAAVAKAFIGQDARQRRTFDLATRGDLWRGLAGGQDMAGHLAPFGIKDADQLGLGKITKQLGQGGDVSLAQFLALGPKAFAHLLPEAAGVDELYFAFAMLGFAVGEYPDVFSDSSVV